MRIPYVVRGEARPQSWIIMIYGLAERGKESERERGRERGTRKEREEVLDDIIIAEQGEKRESESCCKKFNP